MATRSDNTMDGGVDPQAIVRWQNRVNGAGGSYGPMSVGAAQRIVETLTSRCTNIVSRIELVGGRTAQRFNL